MSEIVSSTGLAYFIAAATVLGLMLFYCGSKALLIGSIALLGIAAAFLFTASNVEAVLLYGRLPSTPESSSQNVDVQRIRIALWNIVVPLIIGGLGVNLLSNWIATYMERRKCEA